MIRLLFQLCIAFVVFALLVVFGIAYGPSLPGVKGHEEFAGALIGAAGTIFAGAIAWMAVRRQIENDRQLANAKDQATYEVICLELRPYVDLYVQVWRVLEYAIPGNAERQHNGLALIKAFAINIGVEKCATKVEELANELDPVRRRNLIEVVHMFKMVDQMLKRDAEGGEQYWLKNLRTMLSHFDRQLSKFDSVAAHMFDPFTKSQLDYRSGAEHIKTLVDNFLETGTVQ
jgi:hypothetical protein